MVGRYLLDTHALIWWWTEPSRLPEKVYDVIADPDNHIFVSVASVWEMAIKHRKGKLGEVSEVLECFSKLIDENDFEILKIDWPHARLAGSFIQNHQDPFDRMLAAQSIWENMTLISCDSALSAFPVEKYW